MNRGHQERRPSSRRSTQGMGSTAVPRNSPSRRASRSIPPRSRFVSRTKSRTRNSVRRARFFCSQKPATAPS